jgi:hypothetical protein
MKQIKKPDLLEAKIQELGEQRLLLAKWFVKATHGNIYQHGFPDVYCAHNRYGQRWVEFKRPEKFSFTTAQLETFPLMAAAGVGIWICTDAEQLPDLLFKPSNLYHFFAAFTAGGRRG